MMPTRDLMVHQQGVAKVRSIYPSLVETNDPSKQTHFDTVGNRFVRQKTDTYPFVNIFIEEFSDMAGQTVGGPFQAVKDGCALLCHYYANDDKVIWTHLNNISISIISSMLRQYESRVKVIPNGAYETKGYAIPIADYAALLGNMCEVHSI